MQKKKGLLVPFLFLFDNNIEFFGGDNVKLLSIKNLINKLASFYCLCYMGFECQKFSNVEIFIVQLKN